MVTSLTNDLQLATKPISKISLVATGEEVKWSQSNEGLLIEYPETGVSEIANAFKIEFNGGTLIY